MTKNALRIALIVGILAVAIGYFVVTRQRPTPPAPSEITVQPEITVPSEIAAPAQIKVTGNYSDDWQKICGPLLGPAQADCTGRLDARYGRVAGAPVPPAGH